MRVYLAREARLEVEGLDDDDDDDADLTLRSVCRRCEQLITQRVYRMADYPTVEAIAAAVIEDQARGDATAVRAHTAQCGARR